MLLSVLLAAGVLHAQEPGPADGEIAYAAARRGAWRPAEPGDAPVAAPVTWSVRKDGVFLESPGGRTWGRVSLHVMDALTKREAPLRALPPQRDGDRLLVRAETEDRQLAVELVLAPLGDRLDAAGRVASRSAADRPVQVRVEIAMEAAGWTWWDSLHASRRVDARQRYAATTPVPVGWNGQMSTYPFSCLASDTEALAFGVPMQHPRVCEIAYDGPLRAYGIGFDLALSPDAARMPNRATFFFSLYTPDPAWGLRAAADAYYRIYPESFVRRTDRDGVWMPFTKINDVQDAEDFRFAFHEYGAVDLAWNNERGIHSFRYVEPWTYWMKMEPDVPRRYDVAISQLVARADGADAWNRDMARATLTSAMTAPDGAFSHQFVNEPWCSGTLFHNNSDPDLPPARPGHANIAEQSLRIARDEVLADPKPQARHWDAFGGGYDLDTSNATGRAGRSLRVAKADDAFIGGAVQAVVLHQQEPRPLLLRAWSRADNVTGAPDHDYALYADVEYSDGTFLWAQAAAFDTGTHDWQERRVVVRPAKPIKAVKILALFRGAHRGTVWFDDLSAREIADGQAGAFAAAGGPVPGDTPELIRNGDIAEAAPAARVDGIYLDSLEGWAKRLNFRREHFRWVDVPLAYETGTGRAVILNAFSVFEFTRAMSELMHTNDRLLMANWVLIDFPFYAALLDVPGKEVHWLGAGGRFAPDDADVLAYRRVLSRHKPYPLLLNVRFDQFPPRMMEWFFQRCLLYATAPGMFSHDAATHPYFEDPALYNRDRPLFMKYLPVLQRLSRAGWEPIAHARPDTPRLLVERYGTRPDEALFLVAHNDSAASLAGVIDLDDTALGLTNAPFAVEELSGRVVDLAANGRAAIELSLDAYETHVFRLLNQGPGEAVAWARGAAGELAAVARRYTRQGRIAGAEADRVEAATRELAESLEPPIDPARLSRAGAELSSVETLAAGLSQPDLAWRVLEAQRAVATLQAGLLDLRMHLACGPGIVSPSRQQASLTLVNDGTNAFSLLGLEVSSGAGAPLAAATPERARDLAPGQERTVRFHVEVPAGLAPGTAWPVKASLRGTRAGAAAATQEIAVTRQVVCRIVPAFDAALEPPEARSFGAPRAFRLALHNHAPEPVRFTLEASSTAALAWTNREQLVRGGARQEIALEARPETARKREPHDVVVRVRRDGALLACVTSQLAVYPRSRNLLARDGVVVTVDSTFAGYRVHPLHDGIVDAAGLDWSQAAWASAEVASPHWVEAILPAPVEIREVVLHWAIDQGHPWPSRAFRVEVQVDGRWVPLRGARTDAPDGASTRIACDAVTTDRLRLWQEPGGGPADRPDILWLAEWEVLDGGNP